MSYASFDPEEQIMEKICGMCGISDSESCFSQGGGLLLAPDPYDDQSENHSFLCFKCDDSNLISCSYCSRVWDGNAQCPCGLYTEDEEEILDPKDDIYNEWLQDIPEYEPIWVCDSRKILNEDGEITDDYILWHEYNSIGYWDHQNSIIEDLSVYNDELEISYYDDIDDIDDIDTIPENIRENKNDLKEVMDILYDTKDKFPDGDYLKIMNLVNKIYKNQ